MAISDEIKTQKAKYKDMPLNKKISYFFYYNKWKVIIILVVLFFIWDLVYTVASKKSAALSIILTNAQTIDTVPKELTDDFAKYTTANLKKYGIYFDSSYTINFDEAESSPLTYNNIERISMLVNDQELDAIIGSSDLMSQYSEIGYICDISDVLEASTIKELEDNGYKFLYLNNEEGTKICAGFSLLKSDRFSSYNLYANEDDAYLCFIYNSRNIETLREFVDFCLD